MIECKIGWRAKATHSLAATLELYNNFCFANRSSFFFTCSEFGSLGMSMNSFTDKTMDSSTDNLSEAKIWKSPTFKVIPISFEASSYAFTEEDDPMIR